MKFPHTHAYYVVPVSEYIFKIIVNKLSLNYSENPLNIMIKNNISFKVFKLLESYDFCSYFISIDKNEDATWFKLYFCKKN